MRKVRDSIRALVKKNWRYRSRPQAVGHERAARSAAARGPRSKELRRRTRVVRIFPNVASCMRLIRALCVKTHEGWLEDHRYLNMDLLQEARKDQLTPDRDHFCTT